MTTLTDTEALDALRSLIAQVEPKATEWDTPTLLAEARRAWRMWLMFSDPRVHIAGDLLRQLDPETN